MRVVEISEGIYQFSTFFERANLTFNQYLIAGSQSMLVQTGPLSVTGELIEELKKARGRLLWESPDNTAAFSTSIATYH
jgi:flavorubredoxin